MGTIYCDENFIIRCIRAKHHKNLFLVKLSDAGRIELLHAENRVLRNRLSQTSSKYTHLVPQNINKSNESRGSNYNFTAKQESEEENRDVITPTSLDNEIQNVAKAIQEENDFKMQQTGLGRKYNFDSVTDSEDNELCELSSDSTLPDNLSAELLEERNTFGDNDDLDEKVNNVTKLLGNVSDLGSTLKFPEAGSLNTRDKTTSKETLNKKSGLTDDYAKILSGSEDDPSDIEEFVEYNRIKRPTLDAEVQRELDLGLTGIDSESTECNSSDNEPEKGRNKTEKTETNDNTNGLFELLKNENHNISRALLLAESGYLEDKVTGER